MFILNLRFSIKKSLYELMVLQFSENMIKLVIFLKKLYIYTNND